MVCTVSFIIYIEIGFCFDLNLIFPNKKKNASHHPHDRLRNEYTSAIPSNIDVRTKTLL